MLTATFRMFRHVGKYPTRLYSNVLDRISRRPQSNSPPSMPLNAHLHRQPASAPWREAASLIITAKNAVPSPSTPPSQLDFDYRLLMVKRSSGSSFMASAYVFPGGQIEVSDFDHRWYSLFQDLGFPRSQMLDTLSSSIVGPRPPIIDHSITLRKLRQDKVALLHADVALRISAIRETFEESGILLLTNRQNYDAGRDNSAVEANCDKFDFAAWQLKVRQDSKAFYDLCREVRLVPNVWSLYEWSDWLTPTSVGHRRFDTLFYLCCLQHVPLVMVDNAEITKSVWCSPTEILEQHLEEKVFVAPPQVYEISRILKLPRLEHLERFARAREVLGCERWLPIMLTYDDGSLSVLPGDDYYPTVPELASSAPVAELEGTVDEANEKSVLLRNRIELRGTQSRALCTIEPGCGHLPPVCFPLSSQQMDELRSKL